MATLIASAKLTNAFRVRVVDKNVSANLTATFTTGHYTTFNYDPLVQGPPILSGVLARRTRRIVSDLESTSSLANTMRYATKGGQGIFAVSSSLVCEFPTYIEIDIEALVLQGLPEGIDCVLNFQEGWQLEDRGRQLPSGAFEYGSNTQNAPSPEFPSFVTFRIPKFFRSAFNAVFSIPTTTALRIRPLSSIVSSISILSAFAILNPGKFAALFAGVSQAVTNATKKAVASATLSGAFSPPFGYPALLTITRIKQLLATMNSNFSLSLPEFDVVIEFGSSLASQFTKTISSANSRIRYLFNQAFTNNFAFVVNTLNSRRRNTGLTANTVSSMTSALNVTTTQTLEIANPAAGGDMNFGGQQLRGALAFEGTNIVVGASSYDLNGTNNGIAYVFSSVTGALVRTLNNPNASNLLNFTDDIFGNAVAVYGNYAVIGAPQEDGSNTSLKGVAYVFNISTGALVYTLTNPNNATDYYTGYSVAISDTYIVVGQNTDAVLIYSLSTGALLRTVNVEYILGNRQFVVDIYGDNIIVGTRRVTGNFTDTYYLYQYSASTGVLTRTINNPNPFSTQQFDEFGSAVAIYGNYAVVGAYGEDIANTDPGSDVGKAYIFDLTNGSLVQTLANPDPQQSDQFGKSVDINHRYAIVADKNQVHIFNILDGSLEATVAVTGATAVAIHGTKFAVSTPEQGNFTTGKVKVFSF